MHKGKNSIVTNKLLISRSFRIYFKRISLVSVLFIFFFLLYCQVSKKIPNTEIIFIEKYLEIANENSTLKSALSFSSEVRLIKSVQQAVLLHNYPGLPIVKNTSRNPSDLYAHKKGGQCFDRAYTLAMIYRYIGFNTRHVALYKNDPQIADVKEIFSKKIKSHAALEVKTSKGWMMVDSNFPWVGITTDSLPVSFGMLPFEPHKQWSEEPDTSSLWYTDLGNDPIQVYGLYSRHGRFFPPYNFIPDVNYRELLYNL